MLGSRCLDLGQQASPEAEGPLDVEARLCILKTLFVGLATRCRAAVTISSLGDGKVHRQS